MRSIIHESGIKSILGSFPLLTSTNHRSGEVAVLSREKRHETTCSMHCPTCLRCFTWRSVDCNHFFNSKSCQKRRVFEVEIEIARCGILSNFKSRDQFHSLIIFVFFLCIKCRGFSTKYRPRDLERQTRPLKGCIPNCRGHLGMMPRMLWWWNRCLNTCYSLPPGIYMLNLEIPGLVLALFILWDHIRGIWFPWSILKYCALQW